MLKSVQMIALGHRLVLTAAFSLAVLSAGFLFTRTVEAQEAGDSVIEERTPLTAAELEELVGPIALYPDDLVSIVLPASTYPLQIVQAARYLKEHEADPTLKPNENWDDSVVALLNYPEVIELMNDDLDWTRQLGEAAVYQQTAVLDAIQAFRDRAYAAGNLKSDERQVVTKNEEVIVIEPADPEVIYVPYYEPEVVVVRHVYPVYYYYPRAYPVYYYPYPYGHSFGHGLFWGLALAFTIDWHSHHVSVFHHTHYAHPYYGHYYHYPYYRRLSVRVTYRDHIWRPRHHHRFRHEHAAARFRANRRIESNLASRERHRIHNDLRHRRSATELRGDRQHRRARFDSDKHVGRSRSADHRRGQAALTKRDDRQHRRADFDSDKHVGRSRSAGHRRGQEALTKRDDRQHRRAEFDSDKHATRSRSADYRRNQAALGHREVTSPRHRSRQDSGTASRSPKKRLETRTRHAEAATGAMQYRRPARAHTQTRRKFERMPSHRSSRRESRRESVSKHTSPPKVAPRRSAPRHDRPMANPSPRTKNFGGFATRSAPGPRPHSRGSFGSSTRSGAGARSGVGPRLHLSDRAGVGNRSGFRSRSGRHRGGRRN